MRVFGAVLALCACFAAASMPAEVNDRPIIGILTLPNEESADPKARSYFPASYVKFVESGGARAVPLPYTMIDDDEHAFRKLIHSLNGFLFTGGGADFAHPNHTLTTFSRAAQAVFQEVTGAFAQGETVPLMGTCLGFQLINFLASGPSFPSVVTGPFDSENISLALNPTPAFASSRYGQAFKDAGGLDTVVTSQPLTMNNHQAGVTPDDFKKNANLTAVFGEYLSTNVDRKGKEFVSTVEGAKGLPIFAQKWHPEKVAFEWRQDEVMNHSAISVSVNAIPSRLLGNWARTNTRRFETEEEENAALIYNYTPVFTNPGGDSSFEQCYFFK